MYSFLKSFVYAFRGVVKAFFAERNMKFHIVATLVVIAFGFYFGIEKYDWIAILLCIAFVIVAEMINTAIEKLCDLYTLKANPQVEFIKDVSAGAVLVASIFAAVCGLVVFWDKVF